MKTGTQQNYQKQKEAFEARWLEINPPVPSTISTLTEAQGKRINFSAFLQTPFSHFEKGSKFPSLRGITGETCRRSV